MDGRIQTRLEVVAAVVLLCLVQLGESGECCKAHYNVIGNEASNEQKWCDNYCCFNVLKYDCCDSILLQAPADMRMDFCVAWFSAYWYIILVIVLSVLGVIGCCVCCCCACCRNRTSGTVMVPPQPQGMMIVTHHAQPNDQSSSHTNPFNTGYDQ